jgi:Leucine-rich repeat (LRR) protein
MNKLKRLHTLEAADNALTGLPPNFSELKDLRTLDLCGNKIANMQEMSKLKFVEHIKLARNDNLFPDSSNVFKANSIAHNSSGIDSKLL